jgi:hypothetical protein
LALLVDGALAETPSGKKAFPADTGKDGKNGDVELF